MSSMHPIIDAGPMISVITQIEVLRFNGAIKTQRTLEDFIGECKIFELNDAVVQETIRICKLRKIKLPDAIIAATSLVQDLTLVTRNINDFNKIAGLEIFNPWDL